MFDLGKIKNYIESGLISETIHPEDSDLSIFNYTPKCQFDRKWDDVTMQCRGLILNNKTGEVLARPFEKFFNLQEHLEVFKKELPNEEPVITTKYDGSLGILIWLNDEPWISTRGSFSSEQALWATDWFRKNIDYKNLPRDLTLLWEIIYDQNRIVIKYDFEGLVFLAAIDTKTGRQTSYQPEDKNIRIVETIKNTNLEELAKLDKENEEGFVVFYPKSNLRLKIKFSEYIRLHKIVTGLSVKGIWEFLAEHGVDADMKKVIEKMPDEFYSWIDSVAEDFRKRYKEIEKQVETDFKLISYELIGEERTRKDWAERITKCKYPSLLFLTIDCKDYSKHIWKLLRPVGSRTFQKNINEQ